MKRQPAPVTHIAEPGENSNLAEWAGDAMGANVDVAEGLVVAVDVAETSVAIPLESAGLQSESGAAESCRESL